MILSDSFEAHILPLGDFAGGGSIGTAASTVDRFGFILLAQTTAGQTLSLPTPTQAADAAQVTIFNGGTASFTMHGSFIAPGQSALFYWNGTTWAKQIIFSAAAPLVVLFSSTGVYTPSASMKNVIVEVVGGGGGGGGANSTPTLCNASGAGQAGGYARVFLTRAQVLAGAGFPNVTIGVAGGGGPAANGVGGNGFGGLASDFCGIVTCGGGAPGVGGVQAASSTVGTGVIAASSGGGAVTVSSGITMLAIPGCPGGGGGSGANRPASGRIVIAGVGGRNPLGNAIRHLDGPSAGTANCPPVAGHQTLYGAGGAGVGSCPPATNGGNPGRSGIVIVHEFN